MKREYQMTIDFVMDDYDMQQEQDTMIGLVRRAMDSFMADDQRVSINVRTGAEVE